MAMRIDYLLAALTLALVATNNHALASDGYRPQVGQRHPDFTLAEIRTGKPISLSDFRGRRVLLIQFASW